MAQSLPTAERSTNTRDVWGSLRVRLLAALVLLPVIVAASITFLAIRQFRADKELYVHDLSSQTVELVARNVSTQLESLALRANMQLAAQVPGAVDGAGTGDSPNQASGDLLRIRALAKPPKHGPFDAKNVSNSKELRLRVHAVAKGASVTFDVRPATVFDLRGYDGATTLFVVNREGRLLLHADSQQLRRQASRADLVEALGLFGEGKARLGSREVTVDGRPILVAYARIGDGLAVLQSVDKARVFAAAAPLVHSAIIASVAVVGVAALLALLLAGTVIRPVREMVRQAEAIARGEFGVAVQTRSGGTVGSLGRSLNEMSASLHQREQQVALMQRQVLRAERVTTAGRIIAAVAKEMNKPLDACVTLASECERLDTSGSDKIRDNYQRIAREANRAANVLQNLSRVGEGSDDPTKPAATQPPEPVDLEMIISEVLVSSGALLRQKRIAVAAALEAGGSVLARPQELRSLLLDLLLFLSEHAAPGKPAMLSLGEADEGKVAIDLIFQGPSWSEEQRRQLVDPYASACNAEGSLMLAVSAAMLEEQGGRLEVDEVDGRNRIRTILPRADPVAGATDA